MYRKALDELKEWKASSGRKPLILKGARQVGKTWLMKEFGKECYKKTFYFSFDKEESLHDIFKVNKDPYRVIESLGTIREDKILPEEHLIIFDEIQECPEALNTLKYFNEEACHCGRQSLRYSPCAANELPGWKGKSFKYLSNGF